MLSINVSLASYIDLDVGSIAHKPILLRMKKRDVATAIETESPSVVHLEKTELEYRVIAVNNSGEGSPSNTVMVVL